MNEPILAYSWFRRPISSKPGNWKPVGPAQMASIWKQLQYQKKSNPQPGEILFGNTLRTRYDYVYVQTPLPLELIDGLEEV